MAKEIERKFIVENDAWRAAAGASKAIVQAYVAIDGDTSVRVRISDGAEARLTLKSGFSGITRDEFEYPIPLADAHELVAASRGRLIEKTRHIVSFDGFDWEVDVFEGALAGLVVAEVELASEDDEPILPPWLGREVTGDPAWTNAMLATDGRPEGSSR